MLHDFSMNAELQIGAINRLLHSSVAQSGYVGSVFSWTLCTWDVDTFVPIMLAWNQFYHHFMNSTTLQLHV